MSEPDPFASPYQVVRLPGQAQPPVDQSQMYGWPAPMPSATLDQAAPARPATLTAAFWFWLAATLLVVFGLPAVLLTGAEAFAEDLYNTSQVEDPDPATMGEAQLGARLTFVLFGLGFAVLSVPYVIATVQLRRARNWARVLLSVLGGLGLLFGFGALIAFIEAPSWVNWLAGVIWSLVFIGAVLLGLVTMFLPASNTHVRLVAGVRR